MENTADLFHSRREKWFPAAMFAGVFLFFAFLMWCAPYSSDDLEFGTLDFATAGEYWRFALEYGNGRLLGNLCAILLSNSKALCVLVKAFVMASSVVLIPAVLGLRKKSGYFLTFLLLAAMDPSVFGEAIIWTSGFSNYVPPIWLSLVIVYLIQRVPGAKLPGKIGIWLAVPVLGVASQLFIEHSSGVNGLLAFCFLVYYLKNRKREQAALSAVWLLAAAVGLGLMLLIPRVFYQAGNRVESYRSVHLESIPALILACAKNAVHLSNYYFGACEIPLCFGAIATVLRTREKRSEKANRVMLTLAGLAALYLALSMVVSVDGYFGKSAMIQHLLSGGSVLLPFGIWAAAAWKLEGAERGKQLFVLAFALISLVPLLIVTPTPPRVILQSYVFVMLGALLCFADTKLSGDVRCAKGLAVVCLSFAVLLGSVFVSIRHMANVRDAHIQREIAAGATEIVIFNLPYEYTTWDHLWSQGYLYENGETIQFSTMDFDTWMNNYYD